MGERSVCVCVWGGGGVGGSFGHKGVIGVEMGGGEGRSLP